MVLGSRAFAGNGNHECRYGGGCSRSAAADCHHSFACFLAMGLLPLRRVGIAIGDLVVVRVLCSRGASPTCSFGKRTTDYGRRIRVRPISIGAVAVDPTLLESRGLGAQ